MKACRNHKDDTLFCIPIFSRTWILKTHKEPQGKFSITNNQLCSKFPLINTGRCPPKNVYEILIVSTGVTRGMNSTSISFLKWTSTKKYSLVGSKEGQSLCQGTTNMKIVLNFLLPLKI